MRMRVQGTFISTIPYIAPWHVPHTTTYFAGLHTLHRYGQRVIKIVLIMFQYKNGIEPKKRYVIFADGHNNSR
jgi:hypothetical protein